MKKSLIGSLLLACTLIACSDDDNVTPEVKGNFKSILCNDQPIAKDIQVDSKTKLNFSVTTENTETANIIWTLNGDTLANGLDKALEVEGRSGKLKISLVEGQTTLDEAEVNLDGPFKSGAFLHSRISGDSFYNSGELAFISDKPELIISPNEDYCSLFSDINPDKPNKMINSITSSNNKLYIVDTDNIEIADAQTLKSIQTIPNIKGTEVVIINPTTLLVKAGKSLRLIDLKDNKVSELSALSSEPKDTKMAKLEKHTAIAGEHEIMFIDNNNFTEVTSIKFNEESSVFNIITGNDGYLYAFLIGENAEIKEDHTASFIKINPTTLKVLNSTPLAIETINTSESLNNFYVTSHPNKDLFYFIDDSGWEGEFNIHSINYSGKHEVVNSIIDKELMSVTIINGYLGVDSNNRLYIPVSQESNKMNTYILDLETNQFLEYDYTQFSYMSYIDVLPSN